MRDEWGWTENLAYVRPDPSSFPWFCTIFDFQFQALFKHTTTTKGYLVTSEESVWASRGLNETFNSIKPDDVEGQPLYPLQILFCWESIAIFPSATLPFQICHLLESQAQNICRKSRGKKVASDDDEARWNMWPWDMVPCLLKSKPHNPRLFSCFFLGGETVTRRRLCSGLKLVWGDPKSYLSAWWEMLAERTLLIWFLWYILRVNMDVRIHNMS